MTAVGPAKLWDIEDANYLKEAPTIGVFLLVRQVGSHKIRPMLELSGFLHDTTI